MPDPAAAHLTTRSTEIASRRFGRNVTSNIAYALLNVMLMIWYVPFLIHHLGVAAYGVISLANTLVMYAAIVSASLDTSVNRFLAIDLNRADDQAANQTFNAAVALSLVGTCILAVPAAAIVVLFPVLFAVPKGLGLASSMMFAGASFTTLVAILGSGFGAVSILTHRFDLRNIVRGAVSLVRASLVVLLFTLGQPTLYDVAGSFVVSACVGLAGDIWLWRRLAPQLRIEWHDVRFAHVRSIMGLGGWSVVNQAGYLLMMQTDLILINHLFGAEATGRYGPLLFISGLVNVMAETVVTVLSPAILAFYAVNDLSGLERFVRRSVRLLGLALALPIGLLCGFGRPLLGLWLGPDFADLDLILVLLVGHLSMNLATRPLAFVLTAFNKLKIQGLITLALGIANIALAITLATWGGWAMAGVAGATAIVWTIRNVVILSSYSALSMQLGFATFYRSLSMTGLATLAVGLISRAVAQEWPLQDWITLGAAALLISAGYMLALLVLGLKSDDRTLLIGIVNRKRLA